MTCRRSALRRLCACWMGLGFAVVGGAARAQMTLTPQAISRGFTLTTFASGFNPSGDVGPLGVVFLPDDGVLITSVETGPVHQVVYALPSHADNQFVGPSLISASYPNDDADSLTQMKVGSQWSYYMVQGLSAKIVEIDSTGHYVQDIVSMTGALGMAPYPPQGPPGPLVGHMFVADQAPGNIWDVDPVAKTKVLFKANIGNGADGICFSHDGAVVFVALNADDVIKAFDTTTASLVWTSPQISGGPDGIAAGLGNLEGYIYVNYNDGKVVEFGVPWGPNPGSVTTLATGGSRGDYIAVDPNVRSGGIHPSLLLTQSDEILRMDPPGGGFFGPPTSSTEPVLCATATGSMNSFNGDGDNEDLLSAPAVVMGSPWTATITSVNSHGPGGPLLLTIRPAAVNGPSFPSPVGGRVNEFLIAGPVLAKYTGTNNGSTGTIVTPAVPITCSLVGAPWAAQATLVGGGFGDLTNAVFGVIGTP